MTGWDQPITQDIAASIIEFARNRRDVMELSLLGKEKFMKLMNEVPYGLSIKDFRKALVEKITIVRKEEMGLTKDDKDWEEKLMEQIDTKIFELLPEETRSTLIESGLVTDDPNWSSGVHALFFIWMVNPGTGELELCHYNKDLQKVEFIHQDIWFPKKKGYYWYLPKNYVTFHGEPTFNVKKYTGI
ncbi:MAG: hypothetical protein AAGG81_00770 [Chlamydiota bacterium]